MEGYLSGETISHWKNGGLSLSSLSTFIPSEVGSDTLPHFQVTQTQV